MHVKKGAKVSKHDCYQRKSQGKRQRWLTAKSSLAMFLSMILVFQSVDSIPVQAAELTNQVSETAETAETPESKDIIIILEVKVNDETVGTPEGNSSDDLETLEGGSNDTPDFLESTDTAKTPTEDTESSETSQATTESAGDSSADETQTETTGDSSTDETQTEITGDGDIIETPAETTEDGNITETPAETTEGSDVTEISAETTKDGDVTEISAETTKDGDITETPAETTEDGNIIETLAETTEGCDIIETLAETTESSDVTETPTGETGSETAENSTEAEGNDETAAETVTEETIIEEMIATLLKESAESESGSGTTVVVSRTADVVFVIDVSASMGGHITKVKNRIAEFNALLAEADVDVRINFVLFSDITYGEKTQCTGWNSTTEEATTALNSITMMGGGDGPETPIDGMGSMFQDDFGWRENVAKFSILLTDATYKPDNTYNYTDQDIATKLKDNNIVSSVIASPYDASYNQWMVNGGQKGDITSDYQFLLDWVKDVIIPSVDEMFPNEENKLQNITIEVRKDNVPWPEHGKNFILQNRDNESYVKDFNAVENGNYQLYEVTVSNEYLDTEENITVDGKDITATANYYTVYFVDGDNVYDQTSEQASQIVLKGQTASEPNSPTKPGYTFDKWVTENNGMTLFDFSEGIKGTRYVYAKWKENNVTIDVRKDNVPWLEHSKNFILQNRDNGSYVDNFIAVENGNYQIYEVIIPDEYLDTGESITVNGEDSTATVDYYTVYFVDGDNVYEQTSEQASQIVLKGQMAFQPNSPTKLGYSFDNWMTENNGITPFSFSQGIDGTTYVYAKWRNNTYLIEPINKPQQEALEEVREFLVDVSSPPADTDAIVFVDTIANKEPVPAPKDNEPETGDTSHVEIYATIGMISGLFYLLLYFTDRESGMTEEQKKEIVGALVEWAKKGTCIRKYAALAIIFVILLYYHSIGKRTTAEWKTLYER